MYTAVELKDNVADLFVDAFNEHIAVSICTFVLVNAFICTVVPVNAFICTCVLANAFTCTFALATALSEHTALVETGRDSFLRAVFVLLYL